MTPKPPPTDGPMHFTMDGEKLMSDGKCVAWLGFGLGRVSMSLTNEEMEKFRAFIVRAVNSHEELLSLLRDLGQMLEEEKTREGALLARKVFAAILKAREGK